MGRRGRWLGAPEMATVRAQQDEAYQQSLKEDKAKELARAELAEQEELESAIALSERAEQAAIKAARASAAGAEPAQSDAFTVKLTFMTCGYGRTARRFRSSDPAERVFDWVESNELEPNSVCLSFGAPGSVAVKRRADVEGYAVSDVSWLNARTLLYVRADT